MRFLRKRTDTVFIMLGNGCNMNCRYCLQHPLVNTPLTNNINPEIYDFLCQLAYENENHALNINFFGGEPLLYFNNIKEIVKELDNRNSVKFNYSIMSNGKAITNEMVKFFNQNDFMVGISYDGNNTIKSRLFDVFNDENIKYKLLRIRNLCLSGVISSENTPLDILQGFTRINKEYKKIHNYNININIDVIMDTGLDDKNLLNCNYEEIRKQMNNMFNEYYSIVSSKKNITEDNVLIYSYINTLIKTINYFYKNQEEFKELICACKNGYSIINMDLQGNLYACHNISNSCGNIKTDFWEYLFKIFKYETNSYNIEECNNCIAVSYCQGGCKLLNKENKKETFCNLNKAIIEPLIRNLEKLGQEINNNG